MEWERKEYTTRGADPTTVVEWSRGEGTPGGIMIQEFQGLYGVYETLDAGAVLEHGYKGIVPELAEALHKQLELQHRLERESEEDWNEGGAKIYGGQ